VTAGFTKFNPRTFLENQDRGDLPPKAPKAPKAPKPPKDAPTLGGLGGLGGLPAQFQNPASAPSAVDHTAEGWGDAEEERAALIEYEAGVPRAWAEALSRLDPSTPPPGVPSDDWVTFIDACGRFLDEGWHMQANALGWGPLELFGCDRLNPLKGEGNGLLWRIGDGHLVVLTAHGALVESGDRDLYLPRCPPMPGQDVQQ